MYGLRNSEMSACLFQFSHKTRQTMLLNAYFTTKVDFKRKFNHHQSFLYEWRLTAWTIRKFRIRPSIRIESRIGHTIRKSNHEASQVPTYSVLSGTVNATPCQYTASLMPTSTIGIEWPFVWQLRTCQSLNHMSIMNNYMTVKEDQKQTHSSHKVQAQWWVEGESMHEHRLQPTNIPLTVTTTEHTE